MNVDLPLTTTYHDTWILLLREGVIHLDDLPPSYIHTLLYAPISSQYPFDFLHTDMRTVEALHAAFSTNPNKMQLNMEACLWIDGVLRCYSSPTLVEKIAQLFSSVYLPPWYTLPPDLSTRTLDVLCTMLSQRYENVHQRGDWKLTYDDFQFFSGMWIALKDSSIPTDKTFENQFRNFKDFEQFIACVEWESWDRSSFESTLEDWFPNNVHLRRLTRI